MVRWMADRLILLSAKALPTFCSIQSMPIRRIQGLFMPKSGNGLGNEQVKHGQGNRNGHPNSL